MIRPLTLARAGLLVVATSLGVAPVAAQATSPDTSAYMRALEFETSGKYREAAPLYRASLRGVNAVSAFLGLERVLHELGWIDSLIAPAEAMVAADPAEPAYRIAQLRAYQMLGRSADQRRVFDRWVADTPGSNAPYREYARLLIQLNRRATADSVLAEARTRLGSTRGMEIEEAQLRAATGDWLESARAWRVALVSAPHYEAAAAYSLTPTPAGTRDSVRGVFAAAPIALGARRALASLETMWGSASGGWAALRDLPPDTASAEAWAEFGDKAMAEERWSIARDAFVAALAVRRTGDLALRAATASLNAGDAEAVLSLIPLAQAGRDSSRVARTHVPLLTRALAQLGLAEAEQVVAAFDRWIAPAPRATLTRAIALGWIRRGDMSRARAALAAAGPETDSTDTAGWLALYEGDLRAARSYLRGGTEATPELALALGTIARIKADRSPAVGDAFLALARGDSASAAGLFADAADRHPEGASLLLSIAARLRAARGEVSPAIVLWARIVETMGETPEAPEADLLWARALGSRRDTVGARARLEHLILTYPESALVHQARRELDLLRGGAVQRRVVVRARERR